MTTPQITTAPNQENTDFIRTANDKVIKQHLLGEQSSETHTILFTKFADLVKLQNMRHEIQKETYSKRSVGKFIHETFEITTFVPILTFLVLFSIIGLHIKALLFIIPISERSFLLLVIATLVIAAITIAAMVWVAGVGVSAYKSLKYRNTLSYLNRKQKALLKEIPIAYVENENLKPFDTSIYRVQYAVKSTIQLQEKNQEYNIDMVRFAQAYDNYVEVLIFTYANKDNISKDLLEKYVKELEALTEIVVEEARTVRNEVKEINQVINAELEKSKTLEKELATIRQEEIDTVATATMPLRFQ